MRAPTQCCFVERTETRSEGAITVSGLRLTTFSTQFWQREICRGDFERQKRKECLALQCITNYDRVRRKGARKKGKLGVWMNLSLAQGA